MNVEKEELLKINHWTQKSSPLFFLLLLQNTKRESKQCFRSIEWNMFFFFFGSCQIWSKVCMALHVIAKICIKTKIKHTGSWRKKKSIKCLKRIIFQPSRQFRQKPTVLPITASATLRDLSQMCCSFLPLLFEIHTGVKKKGLRNASSHM